jgi:multicomponent Na+:H+ antiporter subunit D
MIESSAALMLAILVPFVTPALINMLGNMPRMRTMVQVIAALLMCFLVYQLYLVEVRGGGTKANLYEFFDNIIFGFATEPLSILYAVVLAVLWLFAIIYAHSYLGHKKDHKQKRFFIYYSLSIGCGMGIAFANNLLVMLIFYEALTLLTYPLVTHEGGKKTVDAGKTYLQYLLGSSIIILLPIIALVYVLTGTLQFTEGGNFYNSTLPEYLKLAILLAFLWGFAKSAVMPLHKWLLSAMVAPAPVSGLLHAVAVVKAGVFCFGKVVIYIFGSDNLGLSGIYVLLPIVVCCITVLLASVFAVLEQGIKRRLAYSTIASLSVILVCFLLLSTSGVVAAYANFMYHALAKIILFFALGAVILVFGIKNVADLAGMGRKMPVLFICVFLASLSLIGLPPLAEFEAKHLLELAAIEAEQKWIIYFMYIIMALKAAALLPISYVAFYKKPIKEVAGQMPILLQIAVVGITVLLLLSSFYEGRLEYLAGKIII